MSLPWQRAYDFCERLLSYLARATFFEEDGNTYKLPLIALQAALADELQRLFSVRLVREESEMKMTRRQFALSMAAATYSSFFSF